MQEIYSATDKFGITYSENNIAGSMPCLHVHNSYEIYYLHDGVRSYIIDNKVYEVRTGNVVLIKPNVFHKTTGERYKRTLINFSYSFLKEFFSDHAISNLLSCFSSVIINLDFEQQQNVLQLCERMAQESDLLKYDERPLLLANLLTILNKTSNQNDHETEPLDSSNRLLSDILEYIGKNYVSIERLEEISNRFFITKFHLCRIFKEATGMSVFQYINTLKIQQASNMLSQTNASLTQISSECGFNSQVYFCKIFREYVHMTPSAYRRNNKSISE